MKKYFIGVLTLLLVGNISIKAQDKQCGLKEAEKELISNNPLSVEKIFQNEVYFENLKPINSNYKKRGNYVIPVVVHVLHNYGSENISDAQIKSAIKDLNKYVQKQNPDTIDVEPYFKSIIANCEIEFRLAQKDPLGNCTDGIDRIYSYKTEKADDFSKLNAWPNNQYLNIWIVKKLKNVQNAGSAYRPTMASQFPYYDGVMMLNQYFGTVGTGQPLYNGAFIHEIGHYFNLVHIWGDNEFVGKNCGDDFVADTPPTEGHYYCQMSIKDTICQGIADNTALFTGLENLQNFMDFGFCYRMFTNGQKDRMHLSLNDSLAGRSNLWSPLNLLATGTFDTSVVANCSPIADFNAAKRFICIGNNTLLNDFSHRGTIASSSWNTPNGIQSILTPTSVNVQYNSAGWKSITLVATGSNLQTDSITKPNYIYVSNPADSNYANSVADFEDTTDYKRWAMFNYFENEFKWKYYTGSNLPSGNKSIMFNGFDNRSPIEKQTNTPYQDIDEIITPIYSASGVNQPSNYAYFNFKYAAATTAGNITQVNDSLVIYASSNCGTSWNKIGVMTVADLINNGSYSSPFLPALNTTWSIASFPVIVYSKTYFKIKHVGSSYSNNLFLDDISLTDVPLSINSIKTNSNLFSLFPNPTNNHVNILCKGKSNEDIMIKIVDLMGRIIFSKMIKTTNNEEINYQIPSNVFTTKGIYLVTVSNSKEMNTQKLVVE